ncbi:unnamed protein product [Didymodactylos carnosus]|uniref:Uncharacterized protein n=1 Tax=Didymodactylos carnosus TaxID=1234261 RepID=A0A815ZLC4_9BILA|nr:unnamed protein product [Didymodactylos carnosus]CAF4456027.1 unnamed protein product [Didymodactylos carnosus]
MTACDWHSITSTLEDCILFCQSVGLIPYCPSQPCSNGHHNWYMDGWDNLLAIIPGGSSVPKLLPKQHGRKRPYTAIYGDIQQPYTAVVLRRNTAVYGEFPVFLGIPSQNVFL